MDLPEDVVRDFANRGLDELGLVEEGLAEWQSEPRDPQRLAYLIERLQSLQEVSGLLAFPELENAFFHSRALLESLQQRWPEPCTHEIAQLSELLQQHRQALVELENRAMVLSSGATADRTAGSPNAFLIPSGGPPSPFRRSEALRGPANSLTDFLLEHLPNAGEPAIPGTPPIGTRLVQLIDEVMKARHQIRQMLAHAVSLKSAVERAAFLDQACATCPELRASLERVLKSETQSQRLLQFPVSELLRALLDSLRGELFPSRSGTPRITLSVPQDDSAVGDIESTVRVRHNSQLKAEVWADSGGGLTALPRYFGRYTLEQQLGQGAMGTVYLASDRLLNRHVALKLLRVKPEDGAELVERFYREARSMASLQHANLCPVYDFGEVDGQPYLTMAYISGRPLSEFLVDRRPLVTRDAVKLVRTLALALHQAHQRGIVHRDLKPANIMITQEGEPVLMDFGLARRQQSGEVEITQHGMILGSPAYMAPEQVEGNLDQIGPQTDVHALGVILYELLSGRKPFDGSVTSVLTQILSKVAEPLDGSIDPDGRLNAICRQAMAKSTAERYGSALELANALEEYLENTSRVRLSPDVDLPPNTVNPNAVPANEQTRKIPPSGRPAWKWALAVAALVGIACATMLLNARGSAAVPPLNFGSTSRLPQSR